MHRITRASSTRYLGLGWSRPKIGSVRVYGDVVLSIVVVATTVRSAVCRHAFVR